MADDFVGPMPGARVEATAGGYRPYGNLSGKSGVKGYSFGDGFIYVRFKDGATYKYDYPTTGKTRVDAMIDKARSGYGLNRYITKFVRGDYADRF